jgi:hypothetical protein
MKKNCRQDNSLCHVDKYLDWDMIRSESDYDSARKIS